MKNRPIASLSLDLDNEWSYLKVHGEPSWKSFPSYLDVVVPRVLEFMKDRSLELTFFIVGQDAAFERNHSALASISAAGHEIGNHSFSHEPWLHLYRDEEIENELSRTEELLLEVTGRKPIGFRGPGFSVSEAVLRILKKRGYLYDASTFPTFLGPLARAYYFMTARLTEEEKKERKLLFGAFSEGFRPLKPYLWNLQAEELLEIPVTTMPFLKIPVHASYLLYLACYSEALARLYWKTVLKLCRLSGAGLSLLLHPLDFLGADDTESLSFFPAMQASSSVKLRRMDFILSEMMTHFEVVPMKHHAQWLLEQKGLKKVDPIFRIHGSD